MVESNSTQHTFFETVDGCSIVEPIPTRNFDLKAHVQPPKDSSMPKSNDDDSARGRLEAVREKRGYLLPHHGLLAIAAPEVLAGYDATYTALTLTERTMSEHDKEFVWLAVLTATEEAIATHHIKKFFDAGGAEADAELAFQLAGYARSVPCFQFIADRWQGHLPSYDRERVYRAGLSRLYEGSTSISPGLVEMTMCAVHTCARRFEELAWHIKGAYAQRVDEYELAEAISYAMFPGSIPNFVDACGVWLQLIRNGDVAATGAFKMWAETEGQGGFDEASGQA
jgi:alkylhydroperoxidase/carboxymuconolactone decarboxylase family protein YurZ